MCHVRAGGVRVHAKHSFLLVDDEAKTILFFSFSSSSSSFFFFKKKKKYLIRYFLVCLSFFFVDVTLPIYLYINLNKKKINNKLTMSHQ
jgi:hypothetical protein